MKTTIRSNPVPAVSGSLPRGGWPPWHSPLRRGGPAHSPSCPPRTGYTLVELVVGLGAASLLVGGMASAMFLAGRTLDHGGAEAVTAKRARDALDHLTLDLAHAAGFNDRNARAITFTVPDRNNDYAAETIRYEWSGTAGDPLQVIHNGGAPAVLAPGVHAFSLSYRTRTVPGTGFVKGCDPNLVAYWKFDEGSGTTAFDSTEHANHGTLVNGPTWVEGYSGSGLSFDGNDDYVEVPHSDVLTITDYITISAWVHGGTLGSGENWIVNKGMVDKEANYFFLVRGKKIRLGYFDTSGSEKRIESPDVNWSDRWFHIAATWQPFGSKRMGRIYVDGVEVRADDMDKIVGTNTSPLAIGRKHKGDKWYWGLLDEVRIYNRTLSASEIMDITNGTAF